MTPTLNIGLVAYHAVGDLAFVRVPSERGRYLLTDLCVIAVACPNCGALVGEPCRRGSWSNGQPYMTWQGRGKSNYGHGAGVHVDRKLAAERMYGRGWKRTLLAHYKLHLSLGDVKAAMSDAPAVTVAGDVADIDFDVTRRTDHA